MATNKVQDGRILDLAPSGGASSGDPVVVGQITGVALVDIANGSSGAVEIRGVFDLAVHGWDGAANAAVAVGDAIYHDGSELNKDTSGTLFGYALGAVTAGATTTIPVLLKQ
ncbi:DUF2190 family protein [Deferrisoma camini]|uniref:DUF2190 family protein n=1 Tax=Deferrisoma camini TaxID=1035120 RepID=UPI00046D212A|nr:DUF2190 family protein [Deferrisoma camini]